MAERFDVKVPALSNHLQNIYEEEEPDQHRNYFQNRNGSKRGRAHGQAQHGLLQPGCGHRGRLPRQLEKGDPLPSMGEGIEALIIELDKMIQTREGAMDDLLTDHVRLAMQEA